MNLSALMGIFLIGTIACNTNYEPLMKCHESSGEDANIKFENAIEIYKHCFNATLVNFRHLIATTTCFDISPIRECNRYLLQRIEDCSSPDEKYFPKEVFAILPDYASHICSSAEQYKLPILLDHKICYPTFSFAIDCFYNFRFFNTSANLSEEEMCNDEKEVYNCLNNYINSTCPSDMVFQQLLTKAFNFYHSPCNGCLHNAMTNIILYIVAISLLCSVA